jgi:putative NADH-flavin reductase
MRTLAVAASAWCLAILAALAPGPVTAAPLNILIYGATGRIGSLAVAEALERGHRVTAVTRNPDGYGPHDPRLTVARGDLLDEASIASLVPGRDVVIVSVRGVIGDAGTPETALQYIAIQKIVSVLRSIGEDAARLIDVGGAGTLEVRPGVLYTDRLPRLFLPRDLEIEIGGQRLALAYLRQVRDVSWTYVTPPKHFTNGARTGRYRVATDEAVKDDHGRNRISRADFAVALIDEAETARHTGARFRVAR